MIYNEAFDYLWNELANPNGLDSAARLKDYQRKRLRRALLGRALKPYFLEASFAANMAGPGGLASDSTEPVTTPLLVLDGALRTTNFTGGTAANNSFTLQLLRSGGDARVQIQQLQIYDEHLLAPWQCAVRTAVLNSTNLAQGAPWPLTWPVPIRLLANEVIQVKATVIAGSDVDTETSFFQFRAVMVDNQKEDDALIKELTETIARNPLQRPVFLSMTSDDSARSIVLPAATTFGQVEAKTKETTEHLLVTGYAVLFARTAAANEQGTTCNPQWRLHSSEGHAFSKELIDLQCFAYTRPDSFWQAFPVPFLLPKGSSLSALINVPAFVGAVANAVANANEQIDNYIIFRCVTV